MKIEEFWRSLRSAILIPIIPKLKEFLNSTFVNRHSSFVKGSEINHENKHNLKWCAKNDNH